MKIVSRFGARTLATLAAAAMLATAGAASAADWDHYRGGDHGWKQGQGYYNNYDRRYGRDRDRDWRDNRRGYYNYWNAPRGRDGRIDTKCPKYC
jgi:hypothetical protein